MKKALIFEKEVIQVEEQSFQVAKPLFWVDCSDEVKTGWSYENGAFKEPEIVAIQEPKIEKITLRQTKLILNQMGLLPQVESYISSIEDEQLRATAKIEWEYANDVERDNPLIATLQNGLNLSDEQVDSMFREASKL